MSDKYVIKNCPAIKEITTLLTSEPPQFQKEWRCCTTGSNLKKCENITDCLLKKIVEKCRESQEIMDKEQYYEDDFDTFNGESIMAETIMNMLEIEEC